MYTENKNTRCTKHSLKIDTYIQCSMEALIRDSVNSLQQTHNNLSMWALVNI